MEKYEFRYQPGSEPVSPKYSPFVEALTQYLATSKPIDNEADYNLLLQDIDGLIQKHITLFNIPTPEFFDPEIAAIEHNPQEAYPDPMIAHDIPWGGVVHKFIDVNKTREKEDNKLVEKLLVIRQRGILGFEIHTKKDEHLHVLEGVVLFIHSVHGDKAWKKGQVSMTLVEKGAEIRLLPGDEHGMIALSNSVVKETSSYHLSDLIFLFNSQQVIS